MLLQELKDRLVNEGYKRSWYSFGRHEPPLDGYILEQISSTWTVFYFERGRTRQIASFENESDACNWFYERVREEFASVVNRKIN